jgi:enterochelin esterase family protein
VSLSITQLEHETPLDAAAVDRFLASHTFPIVEGTSVTFVYRGEADTVHLQHWIYGLPSYQPFHRVAGTDLWRLIMELPERSRVEYKLEVARGGEKRLINDPLNPLLTRDPFAENSVCHAAGYETPDWVFPNPETRTGSLEEIVVPSRALGDEQRVTMYIPARFRPTRRYPLLVVHDGPDYMRYSDLKTVLDNLIHRLEIAPMIVALIQSRARLREYADDPNHAKYVVEELVPHLESRYPLLARPSARGLMGASFGAVASLSTAWRYPGFCEQLLLQSGSFAFTDIGANKRGPHFEPVVRFVNTFRAAPGRPAEKLFVSCGTYETLIYENRSIVPLLQSTGMAVRYVEARDGHNWQNWRDRLRDGLSWLFPGPLWLVYE